MSDDKMRAEFEKWAEDHNLGLTLAAATATGLYTRNIAWTAWQAAYDAGQKAEREAIFIELENGELLAAEVERLRAELAAAKAASELPVEKYEIGINYKNEVTIYMHSRNDAESAFKWLQGCMKDTPPTT